MTTSGEIRGKTSPYRICWQGCRSQISRNPVRKISKLTSIHHSKVLEIRPGLSYFKIWKTNVQYSYTIFNASEGEIWIQTQNLSLRQEGLRETYKEERKYGIFAWRNLCASFWPLWRVMDIGEDESHFAEDNCRKREGAHTFCMCHKGS